MPLSRLDRIFRERPALHRFPGTMAKRVKALCEVISDEYGGRGSQLWSTAKTSQEVHDRLLELPGFGEGKASAGVYMLAKFGGVKLPGWRAYRCDDAMPWVIKGGKRT